MRKPRIMSEPGLMRKPCIMSEPLTKRKPRKVSGNFQEIIKGGSRAFIIYS